MKRILLAAGCSIILAGCATPQQNVLLGVAGGAVIGHALSSPPPPRVVYVSPPRPVSCYNQFVGRDQFGRTVYNQICR